MNLVDLVMTILDLNLEKRAFAEYFEGFSGCSNNALLSLPIPIIFPCEFVLFVGNVAAFTTLGDGVTAIAAFASAKCEEE